MDDLLTGPASQYLDHMARDEKTELTKRVVSTEWQHKAVSLLDNCLNTLEIETDAATTRVALRRWFQIFLLKNKTRGHGAPTASRCGRVCQDLLNSLEEIHSHFRLFQRPWAYLHRNLSGKYRVTPLSDDISPFTPLTKVTDKSLPNGAYIYFSEPRRVNLFSPTLKGPISSCRTVGFRPNDTSGFPILLATRNRAMLQITAYRLISYRSVSRRDSGNSKSLVMCLETFPPSQKVHYSVRVGIGTARATSSAGSSPGHYLNRPRRHGKDIACTGGTSQSSVFRCTTLPGHCMVQCP